ncbi:hypothetical protein [Kribbella yunnanensis]|uniref:hypothetical protein n=1 Tax=Kribbella yunnanensis TaxID=190194 RepID=UPI0031E3DE21
MINRLKHRWMFWRLWKRGCDEGFDNGVGLGIDVLADLLHDYPDGVPRVAIDSRILLLRRELKRPIPMDVAQSALLTRELERR